MKVLFITRPNIGISGGGIRKKIDLISECLRKLGVEVILFDPWRNQIPEVDIVHFFTTFGRMYYHVQEAKKQSKPVVISPVFAPYDVPLWRIKLLVTTSLFIPGWFTEYKLLNYIFQNSDKILPLHSQERDRINACFKIRPEQFQIVPNGTDRKFTNYNPDLFRCKYGNEEFALMVGSIDHNKNQLSVIRALKGTSVKLVIIGSAMSGNDDSYVRKCHDEAGGNVIFTGHINYSDPMLASAFAAAKVFILPSFSEVMPQVLYQAMQAKCNIVISKNIPVYDEIRDHLFIVSPNNVRQIKKTILTAMQADINDDVCRFGMDMPTWEMVTADIFNIYNQLLNC